MQSPTFEMLAHEIKTPLTAIRINAQVLNRLEQKGTLSKEFLRATLDRLDEESKRLTQIFEKISESSTGKT